MLAFRIFGLFNAGKWNSFDAIFTLKCLNRFLFVFFRWESSQSVFTMIQHHRTINSQRPINLVTRAEVEKNAPLRSLQFEYILCYFGMCNFNLEVMTERKFFCYVCDAFFVLHLSLSRLATDVVDVGLLCEEFICVVLQNKKKFVLNFCGHLKFIYFLLFAIYCSNMLNLN